MSCAVDPPGLRRARASDAVALTAVIDRAYAAYREAGMTLPPVSEGVAEDIAEHMVWVAETEGRIVGGLIAQATDAVDWKLANLAVDPDAGGQGVGRSLLAAFEAAASAAGAVTLSLATHRDMPQNVRLYERLGWSVTGRDGDRIFMAKPVA